MGIVKISDELHEELRVAAKAFDRSLNSQAEHWLKVGMICELSRRYHYEDIMALLLKHSELEIAQILKKLKSS